MCRFFASLASLCLSYTCAPVLPLLFTPSLFPFFLLCLSLTLSYSLPLNLVASLKHEEGKKNEKTAE